jgi:hypothetical protein
MTTLQRKQECASWLNGVDMTTLQRKQEWTKKSREWEHTPTADPEMAVSPRKVETLETFLSNEQEAHERGWKVHAEQQKDKGNLERKELLDLKDTSEAKRKEWGSSLKSNQVELQSHYKKTIQELEERLEQHSQDLDEEKRDVTSTKEKEKNKRDVGTAEKVKKGMITAAEEQFGKTCRRSPSTVHVADAGASWFNGVDMTTLQKMQEWAAAQSQEWDNRPLLDPEAAATYVAAIFLMKQRKSTASEEVRDTSQVYSPVVLWAPTVWTRTIASEACVVFLLESPADRGHCTKLGRMTRELAVTLGGDDARIDKRLSRHTSCTGPQECVEERSRQMDRLTADGKTIGGQTCLIINQGGRSYLKMIHGRSTWPEITVGRFTWCEITRELVVVV